MCIDNYIRNSLFNDMAKFVFFIFFILLFVFPRTPAWAHKVTIFAWVEGNDIHTQSKFSDGKRIRSGNVTVFNPKGARLLKGTTDENGMFSFKIPQKTDLKIVLETPMGHRAVWEVPDKALAGADFEGSISSIAEKNPVESAASSKPKLGDEKAAARPTIMLGREEIQEIIDTSLDRKLKPLFDRVADTHDRGPGITEIIGGIGYIIGLVGVALYITSRRRKK